MTVYHWTHADLITWLCVMLIAMTSQRDKHMAAVAAYNEDCKAAEAELAALRGDAERYRWLRKAPNGLPENWAIPWGESLDAAIDAPGRAG
jgi:hypothetical protein